MAIYYNPIAGPDAGKTSRAWQGLAGSIARSRRLQQERDRMRAEAKLRKKQEERLVARDKQAAADKLADREATAEWREQQGDYQNAQVDRWKTQDEQKADARRNDTIDKARDYYLRTRDVEGAREIASRAQMRVTGDEWQQDAMPGVESRTPIQPGDALTLQGEDGAQFTIDPAQHDARQADLLAQQQAMADAKRADDLEDFEFREDYKQMGREDLQKLRNKGKRKRGGGKGRSGKGAGTGEPKGGALGLTPKQRKTAVYNSDGEVFGFVGDQSGAKDVRKALSSVDDIKNLGNRLMRSYAKHGTTANPTGKAYQQREADAAQVITAAKNLHQLGVLSKDDMTLVENQFGSWWDRRLGLGEEKIRESLDFFDTKVANYLKRNGLDPEQRAIGSSAPPVKRAADADADRNRTRAQRKRDGGRDRDMDRDDEDFLRGGG